jgi:hypothetical protein
MAEQSAYQVADGNDQSGDHWVANQARLDAMLAMFGQAAIEAAAPATGAPRPRFVPPSRASPASGR